MIAPRWTQKPPVGTQLDPTLALRAGLVGFWPFNEGTGLPADVASSNAAASNTATWGASASGRMLNFNGASQSVNVGASTPWLNITGPITMACYASPAVGTLHQLFFGGYAAAGSAGYGFGTNITNPNNNLQYWNGSAWLTSTNTLIDGQWHVYAVSHASTATGGVSFYRDGIPGGTATASSFPSSYSGARYLGSATSALDYLAGGMGWAAIWNRALSAAEHASLAANPWRLFRPARAAQWTYRVLPPPTGSPVVSEIGYQFAGAIIATSLSITVTVSATGANVPGTITYNSSTRIATFTASPGSPLVVGVKYLVTVSGATATDGTPMIPAVFPFTPGGSAGRRWFRGLARGRLRI